MDITWPLVCKLLGFEMEEDQKVKVEQFVEVCKRAGLRVNLNKRKVMVLDGKEGLVCEVLVDRM